MQGLTVSELTDFTDRRRRDGDRRRQDGSSISQTQTLQSSLTLREQQVLLALSQGHADQLIAEQLGLSHKTVQHHVRSISFKLDTQNRTKTVVKAIKLGLIKLSNLFARIGNSTDVQIILIWQNLSRKIW